MIDKGKSLLNFFVLGDSDYEMDAAKIFWKNISKQKKSIIKLIKL